MKIVCAPENLIPQQPEADTKYFCTYSNPRREHIGYFGSSLRKDVIRKGITPSVMVWDFTTIALSVATADNSINRKSSADGWTRQIGLSIHICDPSAWEPVKNDLQDTLRFLTGDFWMIEFLKGGIHPPQSKKAQTYDSDCISLLSGGIDSLVGAIDLIADNRKPLFVSQVVKGNAKTQRKYAQKIRPGNNHFQWSHKIHCPIGESEGSTRGRSIIFLAFAALASSAITQSEDKPVQIFVPENGFISLNIPLNPGRMGSFSTKTTHPIYLAGIQRIWDTVGINIKLTSPYQFKTKGEILKECRNQNLLNKLIAESTSCGKYSRHGQQHCGRCVPCMVRRAAFIYAGIPENTLKGYKFENLSHAGLLHGPNDVGAMATACLKFRQYGIQHIIGGNLSFALSNERKAFKGVVLRGFEEIENLLIKNGLI